MDWLLERVSNAETVYKQKQAEDNHAFRANAFAQYSSDYSTAFADVVLSVLPIAILFVSFQKYFAKGLAIGAAKG